MTWRRGAGAAVLVLAALLVAGFLVVDTLARSALEESLTRTFGTEATVGSVDVGLFSGEVTAEGTVISNPEGGFGSPHFAALAHTRVAAGLTDLLGDTVRVRRVEMEGLELYLERRGAETNFLPVLRSVKASREAERSGEKRYRVDELVLRNTVARVRLGASGEATTAEVPELRLTDLGAGGEGALTAGRIAGAVVEAALRGALTRSGGIPGVLAGALRGELGALEELPGRLDLTLPDGESGDAAGRVRDALEEMLPDSGG